ncbi:MAG TPA: YncE family protein [Rhizomicrobium sp.]|nr:YncE family protein [Rhizomicrobium sp.]
MRSATILAAALAFLPAAASAQLAVSANDGKVSLKDGATVVNANPAPDSAAIIDLKTFPPRILATLPAPASVIGPPQSVAIAPDESFALVTGATKLDPADPTKTVPNDALTVIDLKARKVVATLAAGQGASGVSINRTATLALVANRAEGTVSVFTLAGMTLTPAGKIALGDAKSGPSHVAFTPDGRTALVTRDGDNRISVLAVDGAKVTYAGRDIFAGLRPYGLVVRPQGDIAIVANIGAGPGDAATVSFIDLKAAPPRIVSTVSVGPTPEGLALSHDGRLLAVTVMNGSNQPKASPFFHDFGLLKIYRVTGTALSEITEAPVGHWCQGAAWNRAGTVLLVQCMADNEIEIFRFDGRHLKRTGSLAVTGPAGIRTAD